MLTTVDHPFFAAFRPVYLMQIAAEQLRAGQIEAATAALDRAVSEADQLANYFCAPEAIRLRGEALLAQSRAATRNRLSAKPSRSRNGNRAAHSNCAPPPAWHSFWRTKIAATRRAICWRRSTAPSPKALRDRTCRQPRCCSTD